MTPQDSVAILGGRFDPPHLGHVQVVRELLQTAKFQKVWVIPAGYSAYKPAQAPADQRLEMCRRAFGAETLGELAKCVQVLDLEVQRQGNTFTAETLDLLRTLGLTRDQETYFVLGTDQFENLPHWHDFPRVLGLTHWWALLRASPSAQVASAQKMSQFCARMEPASRSRWGELAISQGALSLAPNSRLILAQTMAGSVSSTQVRREIALSGKIPQDTIPESVREYLKAHRLYGS